MERQSKQIRLVEGPTLYVYYRFCKTIKVSRLRSTYVCREVTSQISITYRDHKSVGAFVWFMTLTYCDSFCVFLSITNMSDHKLLFL